MTNTNTVDRIPEQLSWRDAQHAPTPDIDLLAARIPLMCGKAGAAGEFRDLNRGWECRRSQNIAHLHMMIAEMRRSAKARIRRLAQEKTYYAANLNSFLIYRAGEIEFLLRKWDLDEMPCTHTEPQVFENYLDAYPDCSC